MADQIALLSLEAHIAPDVLAEMDGDWLERLFLAHAWRVQESNKAIKKAQGKR